ncbi:MAG: hypothetical protein EXR79_07260 [Myxococcales bacterium]|nr:hypothetical protein [Myxococcales bacterium]
MADWSWRGIERPAAPTTVGAIALHAQLHLGRVIKPATLWPYALLLAAVVAGSLGLVRLALSDATAIVEYFRHFALRGEALVALGLGTAAVRGEADAGALAYWLLRPRAPIALPLGRWLAAALVTAAFGLLMTAGTLASTWGTVLEPPPETVRRMVLAALLGALVYPAIFLWIGATLRHAAAAGLAWFILGDFVAPLVSDTARLASPAHHLSLVVAGVADATLTDQLADSVRRMAGKSVPALPEAGWGPTLEAALAVALLTAVALALCLVKFQRDPPSSAPAP